MPEDTEIFLYTCPHCRRVRNASEVASALPLEVLRSTVARLNSLDRRTSRPGTGRPNKGRCPGCSKEMSHSRLRVHRNWCVRERLKMLLGRPVLLSPKDSDPNPNFYIVNIGEAEVKFQKGSNDDQVVVGLHKIANISESRTDTTVQIRLRGRVHWWEHIKRWRFVPTAPVGRPRMAKPMP
jgi:hypothetical protein